jgi:hypothetical protein
MGTVSQLKTKLMIQMYSKVLCDARYYARLFLVNDERQIFDLTGKHKYELISGSGSYPIIFRSIRKFRIRLRPPKRKTIDK